MRRIHHRFIVLVILFCVYTANGFSQNIFVTFKLTIPASPDQMASPQSIELDGLIQAADPVIGPVDIKDDKKLPIAAQTPKKGMCYLYRIMLSAKQKEKEGYAYNNQESHPIIITNNQ
jgi:hypothetical protein